MQAATTVHTALRVATLGAPGTFAHQAAVELRRAYPVLGELAYGASMNDLYDALDDRAVDAIILSEQSSRRGWDEANERVAPASSDIYVYGAMVVPYRCKLLAQPGTTLADIRSVSGHGSVRQCRRWLDANLPGVPAGVHELNSVAAAKEVAAGDGSTAVIGTAITAELTGLVPLAEDIDDGATANWWVMTTAPRYFAEPEEVIVRARLAGDGSLLRLSELLAGQGFELCTVYSQASGVHLFEHDYLLTARGSGSTESLCSELAQFGDQTRLVGAYRFHGSAPAS